MRPFSEIKRDMKYPSAEVKERCMNEVARYLRDAYECAAYSEALGRLIGSKYYFGIDSDELMKLLKETYKCCELCENAILLRDLYIKEIGIPADRITNIPADMRYKFVCEQVMGKKLDCENVTCSDIDSFAQGIDEIKIPGSLYPLIWLTHGRDEKAFLYIYEKYVFPAYINLSESQAIDRYEAIGRLLCGYIEELIIHVGGTGQVYIPSIPKNTTWNEVMIKFKKTGEFDCLKQAREKLMLSDGIGMLLLQVHKKYKHWLKSKYRTYLINFYPVFAALVAFALLGEERNKEAVEFMIDHYADICEDNYQSDYTLIILFKTILLADNYEYMNILYAYLLKEKLLYQRFFTDIYDVIIKSCDFIEELYDGLGEPKDDEFFEEPRRYLKETVFEEWGMLRDIRAIRNDYKRVESQEKYEMFLRINNVISALSDRDGIDVAYLGEIYGKNYLESEFIKKNRYYKILLGISPEDEDKAVRLCARIDDVQKYATSIRNHSFFQKADIMIKDILFEKMEKDIENTLLSISELRKKQDYANNEEEFLALIEPSITSLANRISAKYIDRDRIIEYFNGLDENKGCWERLDDECKNMMITSEIVYRTLVARKDAETLDYSPSMIPLTKVIEYLLNDIYNRIKYNIVFDGPGMNIDSRSVDFFRDKYTMKPRNGLEMGPAIKMLSDGFLRFERGNLVYASYHLGQGRSRFSQWYGDEHVDWDLLRDFSGIKLDCNSFETNSPVVKLTIGNDTNVNRRIFIGALEYIKNFYRNKVAHKDGIKRPRMEKCREDMLTAQKLIWMLIYIIK